MCLVKLEKSSQIMLPLGGQIGLLSNFTKYLFTLFSYGIQIFFLMLSSLQRNIGAASAVTSQTPGPHIPRCICLSPFLFHIPKGTMMHLGKNKNSPSTGPSSHRLTCTTICLVHHNPATPHCLPLELERSLPGSCHSSSFSLKCYLVRDLLTAWRECYGK